jgi:hypothetical protein
MMRFVTEEKAKETLPAARRAMGERNTFKVECNDWLMITGYCIACYSPEGHFNGYY